MFNLSKIVFHSNRFLSLTFFGNVVVMRIFFYYNYLYIRIDIYIRRSERLLSEVSKEIKIAEKLKFWEEQDQINKRINTESCKNHEMITDLAAQFDKI